MDDLLFISVSSKRVATISIHYVKNDFYCYRFSCVEYFIIKSCFVGYNMICVQQPIGLFLLEKRFHLWWTNAFHFIRHINNINCLSSNCLMIVYRSSYNSLNAGCIPYLIIQKFIFGLFWLYQSFGCWWWCWIFRRTCST